MPPLAARGEPLRGAWSRGLVRPLGGLAQVTDELARRLHERHPEVLERYNLLLAHLLPAWRPVPALANPRRMRSGLAGFALSGEIGGLGDFFWKRDDAGWLEADLVRFFLDGGRRLAEEGGGPAVLLERLDLAPAPDLTVLHRLVGYTRVRGWSWAAADGTGEGVVTGSNLRSPAPPPVPARALAREFLAQAAVAGLPLRPDRLMSDQPREPRELDRLREEGWLRLLGDGSVALASEGHRRQILAELPEDRRHRLHELALEAESADPFAASWHAEAAGRSGETVHREALEQAWAVSDHHSATVFAARLPATPPLLAGLLAFDAGRHEDADRELAAALRQAVGEEERLLLTNLLGYNAVFGLGDMERGRRLLQTVLDARLVQGRETAAGYLRNTIAYSLFRCGRLAEAAAVEERALQSLGEAGFLSSILQLNLGRLERVEGDTDRALELFRAALAELSRDASPYMLLILHATLSNLHESRGELPQALEALHRCAEMLRSLKPEYASYPVVSALEKAAGRRSPPDLTRGDGVFFLLDLARAQRLRRLGDEAQADRLLRGLAHAWPFLSPAAVLGGPQPAERPAALPPEPAPGARGEPPPDGIERLSGPLPPARLVARALSGGRAVAVVLGGAAPEVARLPVSLVLFAPGRLDLARAVQAELGPSAVPRARTAICLDLELERFEGGLSGLAGVVQEVGIRPTEQAVLAALDPVRLRVQGISPCDPGLGAVLREVADLTGCGVLGAVPFHLRGRDLATSPEAAFHAFRVSSLELMALDLPGGGVYRKTAGATAAANLLPLVPRLARQARLVPRPPGSGELLVEVREASYTSRWLRLHAELEPLIAGSRGDRSLAELLDAARPHLGGSDGLEERVGGLFRDLWRRGVIRLDEPRVVSEGASGPRGRAEEVQLAAGA